MNKTRRLLTLLLALCMVAGMVPFAAFSATPEELANRKNSGSSTLVDTTINAVSDYVATAAVEKGTKPADGTTTGNPFPKGTAGSTSFRIPALVTLSNGSLVAAVDARWNTNDDGGGLDTLVSRSSDNGANWSYTMANYLGDNGNAHSDSSSCFIDPALAVAKDDAVYMLVDLYPYGIALNGAKQQPSTAVGFNSNGKLLLSGNNHASYDYYLDGTVIKDSNGNTVSGYTVDAHFNITGNGVSSNLFFEDSPYKVVRTGYLYLTTSTDGGATWSAPKLLNVKTSSEKVCLVGPGRGLVTKSGMIVFPVYSFNGGKESQRTSFIYSADGGNTWSRSDSFNGASGWSSESAVVELDSNTLRFFYRNGTSQLCYADYTLSNGKVAGGSWGSAVSTGIATNSDTQISAITYSKTIGGKQVILVSCPAGPNDAGADSSNASNRVNGKIFVFTVESNKTLTRKGTIDVPSKHNPTTNNFLYSCLTELDNGKVGILFEDNVSDDTDPEYCELSYVTYDIAQKLNLRFDSPANNTLSDTQRDVTVTFGATDVTGWTMTVIPNQTVSALGSAEYSAFDVTITNNQGNSYTGAAEVKLPLGALASSVGLYPFVVGADGIEKITPYSISDGYISFTAPHFSVMGVAVDPDLITNTVDVTLKVGEQQEFTDETGNYADAVTNVSPDGNIATMTVEGEAGVSDPTVSTTKATALEDGATYVMRVFDTEYALSSDQGKGDWQTQTLAFQSNNLTVNQKHLWTLEAVDGGYKLKNANGYLNLGYNAAYLNNSGEVFTITYTATGWTIGNQYGRYINALGGLANNTAGGWEADSTKFDLYKVTEETEASTKITFTGMSAGTATAVVGTTQYNITVNNRDKVQDVTLEVGQTKTYTDDTGNYENDPNTIAPNANIATMTVTGTGTGGVTITPVISPSSGQSNAFYIQVSEGVYLTSTGGTTTNLDEAQKWFVHNCYSWYTPPIYIIRSLSGSNGYGDYLAVDSDGQVFTTWSTTYLKIIDGVVRGYDNDQPIGTPVQVSASEAVTSTEISFTGVAAGTTIAVVGDTQYNITTVGDYEYRYITVDVGRTASDTIVGRQYNSGTVADESIAILDSVNPNAAGVKTLVEVTSLEDGGEYLIVNAKTGSLLTDTKTDMQGAWGNKKGLKMENVPFAELPNSEELWTISATNNGRYTITQNGKFLSFAGYHADMTETETELTLNYEGDGWTLCDDTTCLSTDNEYDVDYYLYDGVDDGYNGSAYGATSTTENNKYWKIYKIVDEEHTDVTFRGKTPGQTTAVVGNVKYIITVRDPREITVNYQLDGVTVKTETMTVMVNDTETTVHAFVLDDQNKLYKVDNTNLQLQEGVSVYNVPVSIENEQEHLHAEESIKVRETKTISVELQEGQYVTWHTSDDSFVGVAGGYDKVTVNNTTEYIANNTATILGHQETADQSPAQVIGLVHNADGRVVDAYVWDVTVAGIYNDVNDTSKYIKITSSWIEHTTVYYSVNGGALQEVTSDMLEGPFTGENGATYYTLKEALLDEQYEKGFQIMLFGAPEEGYALTFMSSTNSAGEYYALVGGGPDGVGSPAWPFKDENNTVYDNSVGMVAGVKEGNYTIEQLKVVYATAIEKGCTGVMCFTRNKEGENLQTDLQFISEKIAVVEKTVQGILPKDGKLANFRPYQEGMVTSTDEIVFFNISVTLERPTAWKKDAQKNDTNEAALVYKETTLTDDLEDSYFYDQELDKADGTWDGVIDWNHQNVKNFDLTNASDITKAIYASGITGKYRSVNITDALNAPWADDELIRTLSYPVAYKIKDEDIPKYTITNNVLFAYSFNSNFSVAEDVKAAASTLAKVTVVTSPMESIIIDFTQPITISDLTNDHLKYAFGDDDEKSAEWKDWYIAPAANYGDVSVKKEDTGKTDGDGYPLYNYTVTYTPHTRNGVMQTNDVVQIYGSFIDADTKQRVTKVINAFSVYPATTIYYEEDYIKWDDKWTVGANDKVTGDQHLDYVGDADKQYNYGYDPVYNGSNGASNGTQATAGTVGATGTFDFTGTGFEIYANCTEETGYVMVLVKSNTTGQIRLYTVNTKVGVGTSDATSGQTGPFYSVPIVSVQDLAHDSYNVRIVKSTDYGEDGKPTTAKAVNIDAVRIFQTMDPVSSNQIYEVDRERNPSFVELRDLVLTGAPIAHKAADDTWEYSTVQNIISQVYSDTGSLNAVVWLNDPLNPNYATSGNLPDLLENGPKNELYLWPGQAVTFKLNTGVTAQIGMKTVSGKLVTYAYQDSSGTYPNCTMNSSTDMFYHNPSSGPVTITNKGDGVLSITLLKYWGASTETLLAEVSESQIAYALLSLRELPAKEAVLHVTAVDYTGKQIGSVRLAKPGAEGEYVVFTREELLAQLPEGYMPLDEVTDIRVTCGEERTVFARIGKVATLKVEYVRLYKHGEVDMGGTRVPVMGKKTVTETLTKVQTSDGNAVFTAQEIWAAAPAGAVLHGLSDIQVAYGQTENISVFDTQLANSQVVPSIKL